MSDPVITDKAYQPSEDLQPLLIEAGDEITITKSEQEEVPLGPMAAIQRSYDAEYEGFSVGGFETTSQYGHFLSLEGHLGVSATTVLVTAIKLGTPTLTYLDERDPDSITIDTYEDLTAEWYYPKAVEIGVPELRMEARHDEFEAEEIPLDQLEEWALRWLELESTT